MSGKKKYDMILDNNRILGYFDLLYSKSRLMAMKLVKLSIAVLVFVCNTTLFSQTPDSYYLPDIEYDESIVSPQEYLSYQIGEWHITHDQLYHYMKAVCESSPNCQFAEYARTHENRPLINLIISSKENLENIEEIKKTRRALTEGNASTKTDVKDIPLVIYQGYSVHGNESSGANASTLVAYYLLAGKSKELSELLDNTIVIIDPSYNPDGLQRFSTWANMHKHHNLTSDPNGREFNEVWPGGRTNHYWFDLNRDWLFTIHPSSKGRIENFHIWHPDILTDHHEMGSNSTFFFQPGIPSRTNPNTPQINQDLTGEIGTYHASFLDSLGSLYYSKENFDDYYYGKGSTYPDINGCIGILFEQASSRGHLRDTDNGLLSFPFTIRNQVVTSLSTQRAGLKMREDILRYKKDFYSQSKHKQGSYVFDCEDHFKADYFISMLNRHEIEVYALGSDINLDGRSYNTETSYVVPKGQRQGGLVKTIFETVHTFRDSLFYDVSAWTLPLALDLNYAETPKAVSKGSRIEQVSFIRSEPVGAKGFAITIDWTQYNAPAVLYKLLAKDVKVRVTKEPTIISSDGRRKNLGRGSLVIPLSNQSLDRIQLVNLISTICHSLNVNFHPIDSGQSMLGISLGSPQQKTLEKPVVAMIVGEGVNPYEAGATWFQMDHRLGMPVTMIDKRELKRRSLEKYDILIMPDGRYDQEDLPVEKIREWMDDGGTMLAFRKALNFTNKMGWTTLEKKKEDTRSKAKVVYENMQQSSGAQVIGGAIFNTYVDLANPLFYGYESKELAVFKRGTQFYEVTSNAIATPMRYTENPVLSGYTSARNKKFAGGAAALSCARVGKGKVIAFVDNPNFRGYWLGGSKLFANALFFHDLIAYGALQD